MAHAEGGRSIEGRSFDAGRRWKAKLTDAVGHAAAMAGTGDSSQREVWTQAARPPEGDIVAANREMVASGLLLQFRQRSLRNLTKIFGLPGHGDKEP